MTDNIMHTNFIQFLDEYKNKSKLDYSDLLKIINTTNLHYIMFVGNSPILLNPILDLSRENPHKKESADDYEVWQKKHEVQLVVKTESPSPPQKEKIFIETNIENVGDLLKLLESISIDETKEYNIDLHKLMKIKPELEELHQMIGIQELKSSILDQLFYFLQDLYFEKYFDYINKPIDTNNDLYKISVEYFNLYLYIYELIALNNDKKITNGKNELINNKGKIIDYINYSKDIYKLIEKIKKYNNIFKDAFRALYDLTENYYYFEKYIYNNRTTLTTTIADLTKYENIKPIIYNIIKIREGFLKTLFKYADKYHEDQDNNKYLTLFKLPGT